MDAYERALEYARTLGAEHGANAAGWFTMETVGGRVTGDVRPTARAILRGIDDGDPAVLDTFPAADLSGQWADTLTGPALVSDAVVHADDWTMTRAEWVAYWRDHDPFNDVCDAYESAYTDAVESAIVTACRAVLA